MLEWYQGSISANAIRFLVFMVLLENSICLTTAADITGHAQMQTP